MTFPDAPRLDLVQELRGHRVADPYRWLEDVGDPRTVAWRAAQDVLARTALDALPGREALRERLGRLLDAGAVGVPVWRAERALWTRRDPGQEHAVLWWRDAEAVARPLLDPSLVDPSGATTLDAWSPSTDGRLLAYQLSTGGDEESLLRIVDVASGEPLDGPISRTRYSPVAWEPGGNACFYVRRLAAADVPPGEEQFHRRVWRHVVGSDTAEDELVWGDGLDPTNYYGCSVSQDGRWLVVTASAGTAPRTDVWLFDLIAGGPPAEVQVGVDAQLSPWFGHDGRLWLLTDRDAPRGRLCVTSLAAPTIWTTVVPEDAEAVLVDAVLLRDQLVVSRTRHALGELSVLDLDGVPICDVALPGPGTVAGLTAHPDGGTDAWIGWTSTDTPQRALRLHGAGLTTWQAPPAVDLPAVHVQQIAYPSYDGTVVHLLLISASTQADHPRPTVLYGYGGFGVSLEPAYSATPLAWVAAGGVYAIAGLRGGTEEGEAWHRAGMREHKQNVFDDLHAAADWLVNQGWTSPAQLAISGGSNGGLLVGAALTQRPGAYAAVVCSAPLLDMVRYELFGLGRTWNDEYGTADDPDELGWLLGYSPYHHVTPGSAYPAVLFTVFDGDSRVDPLHARKLCAALQHASTSQQPVLLRDERDVGHGARSVSRTLGLSVDTMAFLAAHTGLELS